MDASLSDEITTELANLVSEIAPDVRLVAKYGGQVLCPDPDSDKAFVGGIFSYKDHVSLEFSKGVELDDPNAVLEGSGKLRRHLKLRSLDEIQSKAARDFLTQVLS